MLANERCEYKNFSIARHLEIYVTRAHILVNIRLFLSLQAQSIFIRIYAPIHIFAIINVA